MSKDIFSYNRLLKPICEKITNHKYRKIIGWNEKFSKNNYKNVSKNDFYYKCKICGYTYFNHKPTDKELDFIRNWDEKFKKEKISNEN